jgi:hypothetical protein
MQEGRTTTEMQLPAHAGGTNNNRNTTTSTSKDPQFPLYKTNSVALSPQANYTDWANATCPRNLRPIFVDRRVSRCQRGGSPPWPLVRERTIPTERPPLVDEI